MYHPSGEILGPYVGHEESFVVRRTAPIQTAPYVDHDASDQTHIRQGEIVSSSWSQEPGRVSVCIQGARVGDVIYRILDISEVPKEHLPIDPTRDHLPQAA